jgi:hypothetical protein
MPKWLAGSMAMIGLTVGIAHCGGDDSAATTATGGGAGNQGMGGAGVGGASTTGTGGAGQGGSSTGGAPGTGGGGVTGGNAGAGGGNAGGSAGAGAGGKGGAGGTAGAAGQGGAVGTSGAGGASGSSDGGVGNQQECKACIKSSELGNGMCHNQYEGCQFNADPNCYAWYGCIDTCLTSNFTQGCFDACNQKYTSVQSLYQPVTACFCTACSSSCGPLCR